MAPLLGVKFFSLALKTLSKPIASRIRRYVMNHPDWSRRLIQFAQWTQRLEVAMQRSTDDKEGKAFVGRLTDEAAITRASNLVSEITLFGIATGLLVFEMNQASRTNEEKAQKAREEREELDRRLTNQERLLIELLAAARDQEERLLSLESAGAKSAAGGRGWLGLGLGWGARKTLEGSEDAKRTVRPVDILDETAMRRDER